MSASPQIIPDWPGGSTAAWGTVTRLNAKLLAIFIPFSLFIVTSSSLKVKMGWATLGGRFLSLLCCWRWGVAGGASHYTNVSYWTGARGATSFQAVLYLSDISWPKRYSYTRSRISEAVIHPLFPPTNCRVFPLRRGQHSAVVFTDAFGVFGGKSRLKGQDTILDTVLHTPDAATHKGGYSCLPGATQQRFFSERRRRVWSWNLGGLKEF